MELEYKSRIEVLKEAGVLDDPPQNQHLWDVWTGTVAHGVGVGPNEFVSLRREQFSTSEFAIDLIRIESDSSMTWLDTQIFDAGAGSTKGVRSEHVLLMGEPDAVHAS